MGKVVINSGVNQVDQCSTVNRLLDSAPPPVVESSHLLRRLMQLESMAPYLNYQDTLLIVDIDTTSTGVLSFEEDVIRISADKLKEKGVLERAILFLKLNNNSPLAAAAISDFLWSEFKDSQPDIEAKPWVSYVNTLKGYCRSQDVLLLHNDFCVTHNELSDSYISSDESSAVPWSLAPVYTQILRDIYRNSELREKQQFLMNLIFLGEIEDGVIEELGSAQSINNFDNSFQQMVRDWVMPLVANESTVNAAIMKYGIQSAAQVNYIYIGRSSRDLFSIDFVPEAKGKQSAKDQFVIQSGTSQFFYPSEVPVRMSRKEVFRDFKVQNVIYVSCEMPEVESLLEFDGLAKRVIFIKECGDGVINWNAFVELGLNEFLTSNANIEFIEFNISALKLAKRVRGPLQDADNFVAWQKWLLWQKIVSDDGPQVQRPLSAIDGVSRFRVF